MGISQLGASGVAPSHAHPTKRLFSTGLSSLMVVALALGLAACSSTHAKPARKTQPKTETAKPHVTTTKTSRTTKSSNTSSTTSTSAKTTSQSDRCHSSDLQLHIGPAGVAVGSTTQWAYFVNTSSKPCQLYGFPGLQMLDAQGHAIPTYPHWNKVGSPGIQGTSNPTNVTLAPGGAASFSIAWENATGYEGVTCPRSSKIEVTPPNDYHSIVIPWKIAPYGGDIPHPHCGIVDISAVISGKPPVG
jgi:cytoskeletal protein RodZ